MNKDGAVSVVFPPDAAPEPEWIEAGRLLFAKPCVFKAGVASADRMVDATLPEIAFAGRSNVGKSSLVNALTGQRTLARVSHTPGRTQQLNFFALDERIMLVDLPGYGYAQVGKAKSKHWTDLVKDYLRGRATLHRVLLLIDARHGIKENDRPIMAMLDESAVSFQIVLTKVDEVKRGELDRVVAATAKELAKHVAAHPIIHLTSAHDRIGVDALRATLAELATQAGAR